MAYSRLDAIRRSDFLYLKQRYGDSIPERSLDDMNERFLLMGIRQSLAQEGNYLPRDMVAHVSELLLKQYPNTRPFSELVDSATDVEFRLNKDEMHIAKIGSRLTHYYLRQPDLYHNLFVLSAKDRPLTETQLQQLFTFNTIRADEIWIQIDAAGRPIEDIAKEAYERFGIAPRHTQDQSQSDLPQKICDTSTESILQLTSLEQYIERVRAQYQKLSQEEKDAGIVPLLLNPQEKRDRLLGRAGLDKAACTRINENNVYTHVYISNRPGTADDSVRIDATAILAGLDATSTSIHPVAISDDGAWLAPPRVVQPPAANEPAQPGMQ